MPNSPEERTAACVVMASKVALAVGYEGVIYKLKQEAKAKIRVLGEIVSEPTFEELDPDIHKDLPDRYPGLRIFRVTARVIPKEETDV